MTRRFFGDIALAGALALGGCGAMDFRSASAPIEVIESNYIESTNDAEIVYLDIPDTQAPKPALG